MARMLPSGVSKEACPGVSEAELAVYRELERQLPADWLVLHSLWLKNHARKVHAEIDFVVIGETAILLIEVKGGLVSRDAAGWHFTSYDGRESRLSKEGPFDQVRSAYYAMRAHLSKLNLTELFYNYVWGYAVITPNCVPRIPTSDTQIERELLLDLNGFPKLLLPFVESVAQWWETRCLQIKQENGVPTSTLMREIPSAARRRLSAVLRPDFECVRGVGVQARRADAEMSSLTDNQYQALDFAVANPRLLLIGAAGTGKTLLAFEQARRRAASGEKVLVTCFNRLLAEHLKKLASNRAEMRGVYIANYHQLVLSLVARAGLSGNVPEDWQEFNQSARALVYEAVDRLGALETYDYLVMDEGQDLMSTTFIDVLDLLLKKQTSDGKWLMCIDSAQAIFEKQFDASTYGMLQNRASRVNLSINCRNTMQVASYVKGLTDVGEMPTKGANGPDVVIEYYRDFADYLRILKKTTNKLITALDEVGSPVSDIAILTTDLNFIPDIVRSSRFFLRSVQQATANPSDNSIQIGTVQAFKGLEATAVILVGLASLDSDTARCHLYVGASRARSLLTICLPTVCSTYVEVCIPKILSAMSSASTR
jgi:hypothetical protein